jgi:hypothetical protein
MQAGSARCSKGAAVPAVDGLGKEGARLWGGRGDSVGWLAQRRHRRSVTP